MQLFCQKSVSHVVASCLSLRRSHRQRSGQDTEGLAGEQAVEVVDQTVLAGSLDIGANGVINLMSADARIMVRRPFNEAEVGSSVAQGPVFTQLLSTGSFGTG